jgi:hypothetical protein
VGVAAIVPPGVAAQAQSWARVGADAVLAFERSDVVPGGEALAEVRIVQPTLALRAGAWRSLRLVGMLNLEGATIPQGELAMGNWGEGFVDRRHPHTYLHELFLSAEHLLGDREGGARLSVGFGKGFAPFGTDDPMSRPFLRYPVNHHLSQILERAVVIAALRTGLASVEVGLFNGDEPERPGQWPNISRFGDSWSARGSVTPDEGLELQVSHARVHSPEHRPGAGTDQGKWSLSARWSRLVGDHPVYGLVEWARTSEAGGLFVFESVLAEGAWSAGRHRLQYRFERTGRPEEERIGRFRTRRPHLDNSILGSARWTMHTLGYEIDALRGKHIRVRPVVEISAGGVAKVGGGVFDPETVYGADRFWSVAVGVRIGAGMETHRMGRYGAMEDDAGAAHHHGGTAE